MSPVEWGMHAGLWGRWVQSHEEDEFRRRSFRLPARAGGLIDRPSLLRRFPAFPSGSSLTKGASRG